MSEKANKEELDNVMFSYTAVTDQIEEDNKMLRESVNRLRSELERFKQPALMVCEVKEALKDNENAIIQIPNGNMFYVVVAKDCEPLHAGDNVLVEQKNLVVLSKIEETTRFNVERFVIIEKPNLSWKEIGGLEKQIREVKEVIELPLKKPELFRKIGITPPKGVLLYGEPGTGKTLLAKAVAASTKSTFIEITGSELVQKFIGEGAKLVKEVFMLAKKKAPAIIFIDELDAIAATRIEIGTSGEREVQRTFMQLLAEIDGFKSLGNVKVIGCTNRKDILDPAVIRPGRLDRLIKVPLPNKDGIKEIFKIHTRKMTLDDGIKKDIIYSRMDGFSGAEIRAVCTEAGYFAIRENRVNITESDFFKAVKKVKSEEESDGEDYMRMFG